MEFKIILVIIGISLFILFAYLQERINECRYSKHLLGFHKWHYYTVNSDPGKYWRKLRKNLGLSPYTETNYKVCKYCFKELKTEN